MRARRRNWSKVIGGVLLVGLFSWGCAGPPATTVNGSANDTVVRQSKGMVESQDAAQVGGKLVYGLVAETNGWNPATNQWANSGLQVTRAIFDTLTAYDDKSQIRPFLAESFSHNPDFTAWKFKLRPNIRLSNGKPVNADLVIRNQTYLAKSSVTGPAYKYAGITGFTKQDDLTFVVELSTPSTVMPVTFATQLGVVADPDWLESNDGLHPIGTGPFTLRDWQIGSKVVVEKNPNYWQVDAHGVRLPYLDSIEFQVITDDATRAKALQERDIDVMQTTSGGQVQDFQRLDAYQVYANPAGAAAKRFIMLNTMAAPFDDLDARRALAYATDQKAVIDAISAGFDEPADGPFTSNSPWYTKADYPHYDPVKAKQLVDQVKARHGGTFSFTLQGGTDGQHEPLQQALQQQWEAVGIDVKIAVTDTAKAIIYVVTGNYQAVAFGQFDAPNPFADGVWWDGNLAVAPPEFTLNFARNKDDAITAALIAGRGTEDPQRQHDAMATVQQRIAADVPYIWISVQRTSQIASDRVVNLVAWQLPDGSTGLDNNQGAHALAQVWLKT